MRAVSFSHSLLSVDVYVCMYVCMCVFVYVRIFVAKYLRTETGSL